MSKLKRLTAAAAARLKLSRSVRHLLVAKRAVQGAQLLTAATVRSNDSDGAQSPAGPSQDQEGGSTAAASSKQGAGVVVMADGTRVTMSPRAAAAYREEQDYQRRLMNLRKRRARQRQSQRAAATARSQRMTGRRLAAAIAAGRSRHVGGDHRLGRPGTAGSLGSDGQPLSTGRTLDSQQSGATGQLGDPYEPTRTRTRESRSIRLRGLASMQGGASGGDRGSMPGTGIGSHASTGNHTDALERRRRVARRRMRAIASSGAPGEEPVSNHPFQRMRAQPLVLNEETMQFMAYPPCRACKCDAYRPNPLSLFRCVYVWLCVALSLCQCVVVTSVFARVSPRRRCGHTRRQHGEKPLPDPESQERAVIRIQVRPCCVSLHVNTPPPPDTCMCWLLCVYAVWALA